MSRKLFGKFIPFFLVLAVTVGLVTVLSAASRVTPEEAAQRYKSQTQTQQQEPQGIFAPAVGEPGVPMVASTAAFAALAAIPVIGLLAFAGASRRKQRQKSARERRNNRLPGDRVFRGNLSAKYH